MLKKEKEARKWLQDLNKSFILHWYGYTYIVPSSRYNDCSSSLYWLQECGTLPWKTFDDFSKWMFAARLVTLPMMCSWRSNLKTCL
jgi:hypothetical protein